MLVTDAMHAVVVLAKIAASVASRIVALTISCTRHVLRFSVPGDESCSVSVVILSARIKVKSAAINKVVAFEKQLSSDWNQLRQCRWTLHATDLVRHVFK